MLITLLLQVRKYGELHIEHVFQRPNLPTVIDVVLVVIITVRCQFQGYQVLVIVRLVVRTQTHEDCQFVILQVRDVIHQVVGVYEHLQALIVAQVERGVLIDRLRLTRRHVAHRQIQRLLVGLHQLGL